MNISKPCGYHGMVMRETHLNMGSQSWGCTLFTSSHRPGTEARGWHGRLQCPSLCIAPLPNAVSLCARSVPGRAERASLRLRAHVEVGFAHHHAMVTNWLRNVQTFKLFKLSNFQTFKLFKLSNFQSLNGFKLSNVQSLKKSLGSAGHHFFKV